jgi:tetratricopeptide (TPR) repeat protein
LQNDVGNYKEAALVYQNARKRLEHTQPGFDPRINHGLSKSHYSLGMSYMKYERFLEAHHEFSKAFNLEPDNIQSAIQMARCLSKTGNKEGALNLLKKAIETSPKHVEAKIQLGILYHSLRKLKEAYREWKEALLLDPENKSAQMYLSMFEYESPVVGPIHTNDIHIS